MIINSCAQTHWCITALFGYSWYIFDIQNTDSSYTVMITICYFTTASQWWQVVSDNGITWTLTFLHLDSNINIGGASGSKNNKLLSLQCNYCLYSEYQKYITSNRTKQ
jgi:hypothetical protein